MLPFFFSYFNFIIFIFFFFFVHFVIELSCPCNVMLLLRDRGMRPTNCEQRIVNRVLFDCVCSTTNCISSKRVAEKKYDEFSERKKIDMFIESIQFDQQHKNIYLLSTKRLLLCYSV